MNARDGDPHARIDDHPGSLERLLALYDRQGLGDAPWPPHYRKQKGEPPRVQPSKAARAGASPKRARPVNGKGARAAKNKRVRRPLIEIGRGLPVDITKLDDEAFLQQGQRPLHSQVFLREQRDVQLLPATASWGDLEASLAEPLEDLFYLPVIDPLEERLTAIDESSVPFLDPEAAEESGSPSPSPSESTSGSPSESAGG